MLRIAICDDEPKDIECMEAYVKRYLAESQLEGQVKLFRQAEDLLTAIEKKHYHIYILDIVMPMTNGLELGCEIRRHDREAQIIYTTTEPGYALQAYAAMPTNYLIKPIQEKDIFSTLSLAISKVDWDEKSTFAVKSLAGLRVIRIAEIMCCEYDHHRVSFTLKSGEVIESLTFRENFSNYCAGILKAKGFLQCHQAFIINMRCVEQFSKEKFILQRGKTIPIASKQYGMVRDYYMDFLMSGGER